MSKARLVTILVVVFALVCAVSASAKSYDLNGKPLSLGVGLGVPYGGVGLNGEYHVTDQWSASVGVGALGVSGAARYYIKPDTGQGARMRFSAGFGAVGAYMSNSSDDDFEITDVEYGAFIGIGWSPNKSSDYRGWDFDILGSTVGADISFGYHF